MVGSVVHAVVLISSYDRFQDGSRPLGEGQVRPTEGREWSEGVRLACGRAHICVPFLEQLDHPTEIRPKLASQFGNCLRWGLVMSVVGEPGSSSSILGRLVGE